MSFAGINREAVFVLQGTPYLLFLHLLLKVNHKDNPDFLFNNKPFPLKRGQHITSQNTLCRETGLSRKQVRNALVFLEKEGPSKGPSIVIEWAKVGAKLGAKQATFITIANIDCYLIKEKEGPSKGPSKGPSESEKGAKLGAINNNDKTNNDKTNKKITPQAEFIEEWKSIYQQGTGSVYVPPAHDYVNIARMGKEHEYLVLREKRDIFAEMCRNKTEWFTGGGWADFTIGKFISQWNSIIKKNTDSKNTVKISGGMKDLTRGI